MTGLSAQTVVCWRIGIWHRSHRSCIWKARPTPEHDEDHYEGGEAWADILARRSPEGRAVVEQLNRAEEAALAIQERVVLAMIEKRDVTEDFCAFETALAEVERMRSKVYRMARQ